MIDDISKLGNARLERDLAILVVEKLGIGKPRSQHALVTADDRFRIASVEVAHEQETVLQPAVCAGQGKVFLILLHGQDQALSWYLQERRIEPAGVDLRPLDQCRDFVEQCSRHE